MPANSNGKTSESGGFQAALDRGLQARAPEHKSTGVLPSSKGQAETGTTASGVGKKTGKEGDHEIATVGPALPTLPDPLVALPVIQAPPQSSLMLKLPVETVAAGPSAESNGAQSSETGKVAQAQEHALTPVQTPLLPGDGTSVVPVQNGTPNQDVPGSSASPLSMENPAASLTAIPVMPSLSVPQAATAPALKLNGTTLNANRSSQSADSKLKQSGSNFKPSSSGPSENQNTPVHTFGTALAIKPSDPVAADANGLSASVMPTGNAVLSVPVAEANGHAAADVPSSQTSAGLPAADAANVAAQAVAVAAPSINTAKVLETIHGTELRLGLHSTEFGSISIATSVSPAGIAAQIALDHGALGKALATHLTSMEEKLGSSFGMPAKVELRDGTASGSQGSGAGTANGGENARGNARQPWTGREDASSARVGEGFSGSVPTAESRSDVSSNVRLSVQA